VRPGGGAQAKVECGHADVAQLVEHQLPKLRVAGSNPVVRSQERPREAGPFLCRGVTGRGATGPEMVRNGE
jgi:hypothetical protein